MTEERQYQRKVYKEMDGEVRAEGVKHEAQESRRFCSGIWDDVYEQDKKAKWLRELREEKVDDKETWWKHNIGKCEAGKLLDQID